jgi:nucleoside-diphosphate-sugar epimerase
MRPAPGVEWVRCDVTDQGELRRALAGIETVFHCAALAAGPGSLAEAERTNRDGTLNLLRLAAESGVQTVVYLSSIGVYAPPGRGRSAYVDETWPLDERAADRGVYTQSKAAAERAVHDYVLEHSSPRVVILRPGTIYGPGAPLPTGRLAFASDTGHPLVAGGRRVPVPLAHVDNVIDAMLAAADSDTSSGGVYNIVDEAELDQGTLARLLVEVSGGRIRPVFLPYPLVWAMMLGLDVLSLARRRAPGTARYRLARTLADMRYRCEAARTELGWAPKVSLREGLAQTLAASHEVPYPH